MNFLKYVFRKESMFHGVRLIDLNYNEHRAMPQTNDKIDETKDEFYNQLIALLLFP